MKWEHSERALLECVAASLWLIAFPPVQSHLEQLLEDGCK